MVETKPVIKIEDFRLENGNCIRYDLSYSSQIEKYFQTNVLKVTYNVNVQDVPPSILYIPAVSNVIQVAWATGADVKVKTLDAAFSEALMNIQSNIKSLCPAFPCSTHLHVDQLERNSFGGDTIALLFSGGLDSIASLIKYRKRLQTMIFLRGTDIPLQYQKMCDTVLLKNTQLAASQGLDFASATIDIWSFLNHGLLTADFGKYLGDDWWGGIHHGLSMLGTCAPLSAVDNLGTILISSTHSESHQGVWGSHPLIDNYIRWSHVKIVHAGFETNRQTKIKEILKPYIESTGCYPELRVCCYQWEMLNCCQCEKCCRTITGLILEGIDPRKVGFPVNENILKFVKQSLSEDKFTRTHNEVSYWKHIQNNIPSSLGHDLFGAREFFEWFKKFDIRISTPKEPLRRRLLSKCPSKLQPFIVSFYRWVKERR